MKRAEDIIKRPVITEKSNMAMNEGKYTFEVDMKATKIEYYMSSLFVRILHCI